MTASVATVNRNLDTSVPARRTFRLSTPAGLRKALPVSPALATRIEEHRAAIRAVLAGEDNRLLVITGPCSLHDPKAALDYGRRLAALSEELGDRLLIVMRAYVEKPRTTVGWKGLLHDPHLDDSNDLEAGIRLSRSLLIELAELGLPIATEILSPAAASYLEDTLSWAAIGARTTESQTHRELVSGLSVPTGFKNGTDGELGAALDAIQAAARAHSHFGISDNGEAALVATAGNPDTHLILRGGRSGPNYDAESVTAAAQALAAAGVESRLIVDCSHANSGKDPLRQPEVAKHVLGQRRSNSSAIAGVMLESHLETGKQALGPELAYGVSVTDACLGWALTEQLLRRLAQG